MYDPPPPRRKKTGITRSRTGCVSCRLRHKKCDEKRPACSDCVRLGKICQQPQERLAFRSVRFGRQADSDSSLNAVSSPSVTDLAGSDTNDLKHGTCDSSNADTLATGGIATPTAAVGRAVSLLSPVGTEPLHRSHEDTWVNEPGSPGEHAQASPPSSLILPLGGDTALSLDDARASGQVAFYFEIWRTHCVPALHPVLGEIGCRSTTTPVLRDAVLALSACQLSRSTPRRKPFDPDGSPGLSFKPDPSHQTVSYEKYGTALVKLARCSELASAEQYKFVLAVIILLAHLEMLMGDFRHFDSHAMGAERLLSQLESLCPKPDRLTCQLVANWTQVRAQKWWLRFYFSTPDFHRNVMPIACPQWVASALEKAEDSRAIIMATLCECCRLCSTAYLEQWNQNVNPGAGRENSAKQPFACTPTISALRAALKRWHDRLPLAELPIEAFMEPSNSMDGDNLSEVQPLRFTSHHSAMNYAYYVVSRLLLSGFATNDPEAHALQLEHGDGGDQAAANSWAFLLARIAAGLDWNDCTTLNTFAIGFSSILLPCVLHSSSTKISLWLQDWIEQRYTTAALEEGSFPVVQVLQALRAMHRENRKGRRVRAAFTSGEDGGGGGKYDSYNSQHIPSLLVYGCDMSTGQYYSRTLVL